MTRQIQKLWADTSGATAVEYGIMVALIAAVIIVSVTSFGESLRDKLFLTAADGYPDVPGN